MVLIFDLDDTLYSERRFVESGFVAVADWLENCFGWSSIESYQSMIALLEEEGRGAVFDGLLEKKSAKTKRLVKKCIKIYRYHKPSISIDPIAKKILSSLSEPPYLVTDGHKVVQYNKICALGIEKYFKKTFITHRYGIKRAKPSTYCFELIRNIEKCEWNNMVYIGDNPEKDFVNLTPLGVHTIRVLTGEHRDKQADTGYDALHTITSLEDLPVLLKNI